MILAAMDASAVVIATEWDEYTKMDWIPIRQVMRSPAVIYDLRCYLDRSTIRESFDKAF